MGAFALALVVAFPPSWAGGSPQVERDAGGVLRILDVPYVPQSEALCGGAALAMVSRYWGHRDVYAEDFAHLLEEEGSGIRGDALIESIESRGWQALPFRGDEVSVRHHLSRGRPLVALIEDSSARYHYVVLVGWSAGNPGNVVLHDPASAPFQTVTAPDFEAAWAATDRWTLLVLPPEREAPKAKEERLEGAQVSDDECSQIVAEGVRLAGADLKAAETMLLTAAERCPTSSAAARELAGIRLLQSRFEDAAGLAEAATIVEPQDTHAWRVLASSRFLMDDEEGALRAWAHTDDLAIDLTRVEGLGRTPYQVVVDQFDFAVGAQLTEGALRHARRRVAELPTVSASRVGYRPMQGGRAEVDVAIVDRPMVINSPIELVGASLRALSNRELSFNVANAVRSGELWTASWRWWENRPHASVSLAVPRFGGLPGILRFVGSWEEQSYGFGTSGTVVQPSRRRAGLSVSDWANADLRWEGTLSLDHWDERGSYASFGGAVERRFHGDRLALRADAEGWFGPASASPFAAGGLSAKWRSATSRRGTLWLGRLGFEAASRDAPLDLWSGAGVGHARSPLLRAHPLLQEGIIDVEGAVFGRYLAHGGVEFQEWFAAKGPACWGVALFADVARAWQPGPGISAGPAELDVGAGLRLHLLGQVGQLRIDAARGVRDGTFALSVGWQLDWPSGH